MPITIQRRRVSSCVPWDHIRHPSSILMESVKESTLVSCSQHLDRNQEVHQVRNIVIMRRTGAVTGLPLIMEEKKLTALQSFQKNYERPSSMSGGKKQFRKHECLKIISPLPPPCARAHTQIKHNIRRLKLKHCNYGDGRLNSITICSFSTYHTGSKVFCPCLKHISNSVFEIINRCSAA